ncbi:hypothetical protein AGMMS50239_36080 [Bacteroidia bacterium]|nr:hypothetical protein AGMMS50239_36080 [Bacteroidia bacterium]
MKKKIKKTTVFFFAIIPLAIVIRIAIGELCKVPSESMEPTIPAGSWLWIDKFSYGGRLPERWADIPLTIIGTIRTTAGSLAGYRRNLL